MLYIVYNTTHFLEKMSKKNIIILLICYFADIPETVVRLGTSLEPDAIREGTDVYFDCLVSAHPTVYKVEWRHNVNNT